MCNIVSWSNNYTIILIILYYYCFCCSFFVVTGSQPPVTFGRGLFQHAKSYAPLTPPLSQQSSQHLSPMDTPIPVSVLSPPLSQLSLEQKQGEHPSTSPSQSVMGHTQTAVAAPRQSASPKAMPPSSSASLVTEKMKKGTSGTTYVLQLTCTEHWTL